MRTAAVRAFGEPLVVDEARSRAPVDEVLRGECKARIDFGLDAGR